MKLLLNFVECFTVDLLSGLKFSRFVQVGTFFWKIPLFVPVMKTTRQSGDLCEIIFGDSGSCLGLRGSGDL